MSAELPPGYPAMWETHAVLADGTPVELRPVRPSDRSLIEVFHRRQSPQSIYFRFFQYHPELSQRELDYFTEVDYVHRMAFVALIGGELVAVARYESRPGDTAPEVAFFVDDGHHGRGLATLLLEYLAAAARSRGIRHFSATVLPENHAMLGVFRRAGFGMKTRFAGGVIEVELDIALTPSTSLAISERQSRARSRSVARLLRPASVAVVGASRQAGSVGHELLRNLLRGFTGTVHAVNPAAGEVLGRPAYPSLTDIGEPVDLAVIAVPAAQVEAVMADAAAAGTGAALIVSSGFADVGGAGLERERRLVGLARSNGMRVVGPNAFGMVNTDPAVGLRALFVPIEPRPGPVALMSESGPLGGAVLDRVARSGVGISSFVAAGNRADVSVNDLLDYWLADDATRAVLLHVETYGNLQTFAGTARMVSLRKPIVSVAPAQPELVELLERAGVILVEGVAELADMARVVATQPLPDGMRVAVVANAASVARLAVAACHRHGLEVVVPADLPPGLRAPEAGAGAVLVADVDVVLPDEERGEPDHTRILAAVAASAEVDAVLAVLVPTLDLPAPDLAELITGLRRSIPKPLLAAGLVELRLPSGDGVPVFTFPEEAAQALGRLAAYARWRRRNLSAGLPADDPGLRVLAAGARTHIEAAIAALGAGGSGTAGVELTLWSEPMQALMATLELPVAPWRRARSRTEVLDAAQELGYPVVLKAFSLERRSVGESGGAAIDLHNRRQVAAAFDRMMAARGRGMLPAVVQRQVDSSANLKLDLIQDPDRGPLITLGLGGGIGAGLAPLARRYLPLLDDDPAAMVAAVAALVQLDPATSQVLTDLVAHVGRLAAALPELGRLSLDPVLAAGPATAAADVTLRLRPPRPDPLAEVRRL